jgi:uncharacterized protein YbjT (DUF2867 family)
MESLPLFVNKGRASYFGKQPNPVPFVAAKDFAGIVAKVYNDETKPNKSFAIVGPEAITFQDAMTKYFQAKAPEIKKVDCTPYAVGNINAFLAGSKALKGAVHS